MSQSTDSIKGFVSNISSKHILMKYYVSGGLILKESESHIHSTRGRLIEWKVSETTKIYRCVRSFVS